jgi:nucleoid-associated protein YgaU
VSRTSTSALGLVASAALVVTLSGVVAAFLVDDDASGPRDARVPPPTTQALRPPPPVSEQPSVPTSSRPPQPVPSPRPPGEVAPPSPALPGPDPRPTRSTLVYTVKPGDTLSEIAWWFTLNGYRQLYEDNREVIGSDPDRIRPGQVYTIRNGLLRMG